MKYSGKTSFSFEIDRFQLPPCNDFLKEEELDDDNENYIHSIIQLEIEGYANFASAITTRLPEDCSPEESEIEIISAIDGNNKEWLYDLSSDEMAELKMVINEKVMEEQNDFDEDHEDDFYDDGFD